MSDRFLHDIHEPPRSEFTHNLYQRINTPMQQKPIQIRRFAFGTALCLLLIGISLIFWPASRVFAQQIVNKMGHWLFPNLPTYAEQYELAISTSVVDQPLATGAPVEWQAPPLLSLEEASAQAGFNAVGLKNIPSGLKLVSRSVSFPDELNPFTAVTTVYSDGNSNLSFTQMQFIESSQTVELPVGDALVEEVELAQTKALWIEHLRLSTYLNADQKVEPMYANVLTWEFDGMAFRLKCTPGMSQEEMLEIAQSTIGQ